MARPRTHRRLSRIAIERLETRIVLNGLPPIQVIDDGESGYSTSGSGWSNSGSGYLTFDGDFVFHRPGTGAATSVWEFAGLDSGWYELAVTWRARSNAATNAGYRVSTGLGIAGSVSLNQRLAPVGITWEGQVWQSLGVYYVDSGHIEISVSDNVDGILMVDAARLVPLPDLRVNGSSIWATDTVDFGASLLGQSPPGVLISNASSVTASWRTTVSLSGGEQTSNWQALEPSMSVTVPISLSNASPGPLAGELILELADHRTTPRHFHLQGRADVDGSYQPKLDLLLDESIPLSAKGVISFESTTTHTLRLTNSGRAPLSMSGTVQVPAGFHVLTQAGNWETGSLTTAFPNAVLAAGESASLIIHQDETGAFVDNSVLSFTTSAGNAPAVNLELRAPGQEFINDVPLARGWEKRSASWLRNYQQNFAYARPEWVTVQAVWSFVDLAPGVYDIWSTWVAATNLATNAAYALNADHSEAKQIAVNQRARPSDGVFDGVSWEKLGTVTTLSGAVSVKLTNAGANGIVQADAIRLTRNTLMSSGDRIIDAGDTGYSESGLSWFHRERLWITNFDGDFRYSRTDWVTTTAQWDFGSMPAGRYEVLASWMAMPNFAADAPYSVLVGSQSVLPFQANQQESPTDLILNGQGWKSLGVVEFTKAQSVRVQLSNRATSGVVTADAIYLRRLDEPAFGQLSLQVPQVPAFRFGDSPSIAVTDTGTANEFRFWLKSPTGSWELTQDSGASTWTWNTSQYAPGDYQLRVEVQTSAGLLVGTTPIYLRESANQLWERVLAPYLLDDLWYPEYQYDAANFLMVPLVSAFHQNEINWLEQFAQHFQRFAQSGPQTVSLDGRLSWLQYLSLPSEFVAQAAVSHRAELVTPELLDLLYAEVSRFWLEEPALGFTGSAFANMRDRLAWKLAVDPATLAKSFHRAIVDEEAFLLMLAANLRTYERVTGTRRAESAMLDDIMQVAHMVFDQRGTWQADRWLFQVGIWDDQVDYAYIGNQQLAPGLPPAPLQNTSPDTAHAHRIPALLDSLINASSPGGTESEFYANILAGAERQFMTQVLIPPTNDFGGYRTTNFMDGANGVYRYSAATGSGYGPDQLSGRFLYGWWTFFGSNAIRQVYQEVAQFFPLQPNVLTTYFGPPDNRHTHPLTVLPAAYQNGFLELTSLLAATA